LPGVLLDETALDPRSATLHADGVDLDHTACYRALSLRDSRFDGRFFSCVKTTGIYCRPVCPARVPRPQNVIFLPTAFAAQEAGFRPCLRCRPETAPELGAWRGTSNTVSRALALIELGALDERDITALAERVGIGERQLRRLFQQHLGASPIAVAQTRRILLAKQLIHETRMPMTEIAYAAGFGSVRRFNETFRDMYGRPPSALRRGKAAAASGQVELLLRYQAPYDWPAMLGFLRQRAIPGIESVRGEVYTRTIALGGQHGVVTVSPSDSNALRATIQFPSVSGLPAILARLRRVFDLTADAIAIGEHLAADPLLAPLVAARPGLRVPGAWDGFELAIRAVLGQQITVVAARTLAARLVSTLGEPLAEPLEGLTHVFPAPETLAAADLSRLGVPRARAETLIAVARAAVADPDLFGDRSELDEAVVRLRAIRGVGEWTAQYIALRQLRQPDAFPATDLGILRGLATRLGRKPDVRELLLHAERWRPWRAYAAQHLWAVA